MNQPTIRHLLSGILLVLFAFSVTPKKFLHDWVAKHKDTSGKFASDGRQHLQQSFYSCHTEDQVVESPFIPHNAVPVISVPVLFRPDYAELVARWYSTRILFSSLRGPPAKA